MYVCSCHAVKDLTVRAAIAAGATSVAEIGARCTAGTSCGGCHALLERLLGEAAVAVRVERHTAA